MLNGIYTALVTPFNNGAIDLISLKKLLDKQIAAEVDGIVILGTTGEASTVSNEERKLLIQSLIQYVDGKTKVIIGASSNSTDTAIKYTKQAEDLGADYALIAAPYYNRPTQEGLFAHYQAIDKNTKIPIIVYNVPSRTSVDIADVTIAKIACLDNIVAIKDATGDLQRPINLSLELEAVGKDLIQPTGNDANAVAFNAHGGSGCISVTANIAPKLCKQLQMLMAESKYKEALQLQKKLFALHNVMFCETNPVPIKYAAYSLDLIELSEVRLPLVQLSAASQRDILNAIHDFGDLLC